LIKRFGIILSVLVILGISVFIGKSRQVVDVEGSIFSNFGSVQGVKKVTDNFYYLYSSKNAFGKPASVLSIASAEGYSGPIEVGVNYDIDGKILKVIVLSQTETPGFFRRVERAGFTAQYIGKNIQENFKLGENIDAVSSATISCNGINSAVQKANIMTCDLYFKDKFTKSGNNIPVQGKEILLVILYIFAIGLSFTKSKIQRRFLPLFRLISVVLLGFFFKSLLSITHFNNLILGNFPDNQYYWYLVIGLFSFSILFLGKNLYFAYICPMGILQDYVGKLPVKKWKFKQRKYYQYPAIVMTLGILVYAVVANQPGYLGYEIFGPFFQLDAASFLFYFAIINLVLSLFIRRFWCRFLCPVGVIGRFMQSVRNLFPKKNRNRK